MGVATCPYCNEKMRVITNLRTNSARSYFICDHCGSRSPRAKRDFVEDIKGLPTRDRVPRTIALVEHDAFEMATRPFDIESFSVSDEDLEDIFKID